MLEKDIERKVCDYAKKKDILSYKFSSPARAAVPDRLFVTPQGRVFFIEFKRPGAKATVAQQREHLKLMERNVKVFVIDDIDKGRAVIDAIEGD